MQAAILAGGLGTRLRPVTDKVPKAMVPVNDRPFLEYEIELLEKGGIGDFVFCVGYLGKMIEDHFGDGSSFGVRIRYSYDGDSPLGPIGGLKKAEPLLDESFFVTYGDAYLRLDYAGMMRALAGGGKLGVMATYRNEGRFGKSDVVVRDGMVAAYVKEKAQEGMSWINFGVTALKRDALRFVEPGNFCDEESFYNRLVGMGQLAAFETDQRFYEIGSQGSLDEFARFAKSL